MAAALNTLIGSAPSQRRRVGLLALVLGVIFTHVVITQRLADRMLDLSTEAAMPARIEVAYVREMALSAPPPTAAPAAPPMAEPAARAPRVKPLKPAKPASAPEARPETEPLVAVAVPDPVPEATVAAAVEGVTDAAPTLASVPPTPLATAPQPAASAASAFEWPASTRMSYTLTGNYRGEVNGSAQVEWIRVGSHYQMHLDLVVGPSFAPLITRRMSSDGEITADGLAPRRYDQDTKVVLRERRRVTMSFEPGSVVLANGERRDSAPGVQDTASQFVQLTYVFSTRPEMLRVGGSVEFPLALPHRVGVWVYDVVDEETLATPFGPLPSIHLKPRVGRQKPGDLSIEIWFAPQLRYLPARIRIEQDEGNYIDVLLAKRPEMGAP